MSGRPRRPNKYNKEAEQKHAYVEGLKQRIERGGANGEAAAAELAAFWERGQTMLEPKILAAAAASKYSGQFNRIVEGMGELPGYNNANMAGAAGHVMDEEEGGWGGAGGVEEEEEVSGGASGSGGSGGGGGGAGIRSLSQAAWASRSGRYNPLSPTTSMVRELPPHVHSVASMVGASPPAVAMAMSNNSSNPALIAAASAAAKPKSKAAPKGKPKAAPGGAGGGGGGGAAAATVSADDQRLAQSIISDLMRASITNNPVTVGTVIGHYKQAMNGLKKDNPIRDYLVTNIRLIEAGGVVKTLLNALATKLETNKTIA